MTLADAVAAILFLGVVLYAVFGGADFGSGVWDLLAGDRERGGAVRRLVDHSIGPVWEANHVWLIFILVFLWTGFPRAFVSLVGTLYIPVSLVALGIVFRGSAFAYRKFADDLQAARVYGVVFAASSLLTPFFLGMAAGAVASGRIPADGVGDRIASWTGPTSWLGGVLAVLTCAFLAAVFLARDADLLGHAPLAEWFRTRAVASGIVTGAVALVGVGVILADAPTLAEGLTGRAAVEIVLSGIGGVSTIGLVGARRYAYARITAAVSVAAVVIGWGAGQYPWLLVDEVTIADAAGAPATLVGLLAVFGLAVALVGPSLVGLFVLVERGLVAGSETAPTLRDP